VELRTEAPTLREAFGRIAVALFAATIDPLSLEEREVREVRAHGPGLPALLHRWLEECLYVHEVEGFGCRSVELVVFDALPTGGAEPLRLHAVLRGEPIDPARHVIKAVIGGISRDGLVVDGPGPGFRVQARLEP
jgi:SHS2 domain-containing protein